ncbi:MAG: DivIVA domain-containing protein [Clostridiales bacterium]
MNFTPNELQNIEFKKSLRGYDENEVKDIVQRIIEDYSFYIQENTELRDRLALLNEGIQHYKSLEESLKNTLLIAEQTGENIKKTSYDKAEAVIKEAELKAHEILNKANEDVVKIRYDYEDMKRSLKAFRAKSESLIKFQLESLRHVIEEESIDTNSKINLNDENDKKIAIY